MTRAVEAVVVVVPVHDEEALLGECLDALAEAAAAVDVPVSVWVVLDACTDRSAEIAAGSAATVLTIDEERVGAARRIGVDAALRRVAHLDPDRVWIANTDGDSAVPAHWISTQLRLAAEGADLVVGTVRPDFRDLSIPHSDAWWTTHLPGVANGAVHGTNLGFRARTYLAAGGYDALAEHEDVRLVERMRAAGSREVDTDEAWVRTSGRLEGRTPGGYARYLREDLIRDADEVRATA